MEEKKRFAAYSALFFVLFLAIGLAAKSGIMSSLDKRVAYLTFFLVNDYSYSLMQGITYLAPASFITFYCIVLVLYLTIKKEKKFIIFILFNAISILVLTLIFKYLFAVMRPYGLDWMGYSYPSGHTTAAFVVFGSLAIYYWDELILRGGFVSFAFLVGLSRIVLGVHWASDVLGGYLLSAAVLSLSYSVFILGKREDKNKKSNEYSVH